MSVPAAGRGPSLFARTLGAVLVAALVPMTATAQPAISDSGSASETTEKQASYRGFLDEPRILREAIDRAVDIFGGDGSGPPTSGFFIEMSNMITGSGWISGGPGYRRTLFSNRALVETSAALSWRFYKLAQARFEVTDLANDHLSIGSQLMWRDLTQIQYFGLSEDSLEESRSQYRMTTTNIVGYARVRPRAWLTVGGDVGYLRRPTLRLATGPFQRDVPDAFTVFPDDPGVGLAVQPSFLHAGASVTADTRDHRGHATRGGVYRAAWTTFSDRDTGVFTFHRYEAEAAQFIPLADQRWVFAFHGWTVVSDVAEDRDVPFYLMPSLGGSNTIRAYSDYRFHDHNLAVVTAESRWALVAHLDVSLFFDAGNVARRAADLNFEKTAYGVGFRLHTQHTTLGRIEFARGNGGWNVLFRTSDPLHLKRLSRRTAAIPFVP